MSADQIAPRKVGKDNGRPFTEFRDEGLLWLVNATVFHPRGYALALHFNEDHSEVSGWSLLGDGTESWYFDHADPTDEQREKYGAQSIDELFARAKALMP